MIFHENDCIHGFRVNRVREIPEAHGVLHELTHEVTGASLIYLQTEADNKLFSVAFKTIPADDTGVFHILEHSCLSGSAKYPLREPFVELLKSSMNTFLNALTFPDKTLYPVSSRNDKDFHNLMGVYLDAVFAPNVLRNPNIFYQEGWHYELKEDQETPIYKGVVFNEMKGAESSVDTVIRNELTRMLYGDTCYGFVSGGDVEKIPTLTYENFLEMYRKYYHPSNSVFYLEGNLNLDRSLADIAAYLDSYQALGQTFSIPIIEAPEAASLVKYYDIGEDEEEEEDEADDEAIDAEDTAEADAKSDQAPARAHITYGKLFGTYLDKNLGAAISLLADYLTGSNEAPLSKAVLSSGLAENFSIGLQEGIKQPYFQISVTNCRYEDREAIERVIFDTAKAMIQKGLSRHDLGASLNEMEFQMREEEEPKALYHNIRVLDSAMYGGDPALYLSFEDTFSFLREQLKTDYYEKLMAQLFDLSDMQILYMLPSKTIGEEKRQREEQRLQEIGASWSAEERTEILKLNERLLEWQQTPDSPEILDTIPKLSLSDVDPNPIAHETEVSEHRGVTFLHHSGGTDGIAYINLYFPIPYRDQETLQALSLLPGMLGILSTADRGPLEFQTDCQEHLGDLSYDIFTSAKAGETETTDLYFEVSIAALNDQIPEGLRLAKEVLHTTRFEEEDLILQKLAQRADGSRRSIIGSGHNYALLYTEAALNAESAAEEMLHGLTQYWYVRDLKEAFEAEEASAGQVSLKEKFYAVLRKAQKEIFTSEGMLISVTGNQPIDEVMDIDAWIDAFAPEEGLIVDKTLPAGDIRMNLPKKTAVTIPSGVSYAVTRGNLQELGSKYSAKWRLASGVLRYGYLWDEIRVKGGAYGTNASFNNLNALGFNSYRDPDPIRSLSIYEGAGAFLREFAQTTDSLESNIISTLAGMDPLLSPGDIGDYYDNFYLKATTDEKRIAFRRQLLALKPEDLVECADALERLKENQYQCVIGHADVTRELEKQGFTVMNI